MTLLSLKFFLFLIVSAVLYYVSPEKARVYVLAVASAVFYFFLGVISFACIIFATVISFFLAWRIKKSKKVGISGYLVLGVSMLLAVWLGVRAATGIYGLVAPIGISFYILRIISYLVDVKRGSVSAERNFFKYLLFTSFFPLAFLGPIAKYKECRATILKSNRATWENISGGILRILFGAFKKVVVADALIEPVRKIISNPEKYFGAYVLILIVLYSIEIYFDFSGAIDIALGAASIFGVSLPENFNKPFSSKSLAEFWNRWHITLGEWFEHYVFYPLSLSKTMQRLSRNMRKRLGVGIGKRIPLYLATLVTWCLTGLWHGGAEHYLTWGLLNGILVLISSESTKFLNSLEDKCPRIGRAREKISFLAPVRVFFVIGAVRLFDIYRSTPLTFRMLASVITRPESYLGVAEKLNGIISFAAVLSVALGLVVGFVVSKLGICSKKIAERPYVFALCSSALFIASLIFGTYGYGYNASDFIYSQF